MVWGEGYHQRRPEKPMSNPGRAARKRGATEMDSTTTNTFRPGQVVAVDPSAFGNFDEVSQGTVQKADKFGRVVSRRVC